MQEALNDATLIWNKFEEEYNNIPIKKPGPGKDYLKVANAKNTLMTKLKLKAKEYEDDPEIKKAFNSMKNVLLDKLKLFD
jgi:CO dehydrogenase nickel-insertion accessory protein CooC1